MTAVTFWVSLINLAVVVALVAYTAGAARGARAYQRALRVLEANPRPTPPRLVRVTFKGEGITAAASRIRSPTPSRPGGMPWQEYPGHDVDVDAVPAQGDVVCLAILPTRTYVVSRVEWRIVGDGRNAHPGWVVVYLSPAKHREEIPA